MSAKACRLGRAGGHRQHGIALLSVMIMALVVSAIMTGIFYRHELAIRQLTRSLHGEQALLFGLGAESYALKILADDRRDTTIDYLQELWAYPVDSLPVEEALLSIRVVDLQGRFNLNNLSVYNVEKWNNELPGSSTGASSYRQVFERLQQLRGLETDPTRTASLVDWLDQDGAELMPGSAEDASYLLQTPARRAANTLLGSLAELAAVQGYEGGFLAAMRDPDLSWRENSLLTALPEVTAININTAPPVVLLALHPRFDEQFVEQILAARPINAVSDFYRLLMDNYAIATEAEAQNWLPPALLTVASHYFELSILVRLGVAQTDLRVTVFRRDNGGALVLARDVKALPDWADIEVASNVGQLAAKTGAKP